MPDPNVIYWTFFILTSTKLNNSGVPSSFDLYLACLTYFDNISIFSFNTHKKHTLSEQKFVQQRVRLYQRFGTKYLIVTSSWAFMSVSVIMCQNLHICWGFQLLHLCTTYSPRPFLFPKCQNFAREYVWITHSLCHYFVRAGERRYFRLIDGRVLVRPYVVT